MPEKQPWRIWVNAKPQENCQQYTVWCLYNTVNFLQNIHERHPAARPSGWAMGCLFWVQPLVDILPQFLQWRMKYHVILDCVITALNSETKQHSRMNVWDTLCDWLEEPWGLVTYFCVSRCLSHPFHLSMTTNWAHQKAHDNCTVEHKKWIHNL